MGIKPVFNEYKAVTYICKYFWKAEDQVMKQAAENAFENNMNNYETMKTIAKFYLSNGECSVQDTIYHI